MFETWWRDLNQGKCGRAFGALRYTSTRQLLTIALAATAMWSPNSIANDSPLQYRDSYRHYDTNDGLPQNSITALVESADGYLWLGTYGGLTRFDGLRFSVFHATADEGPGSDRILSLLEDRPGRLWIGTEDAGVSVLRDGEFERLEMCGGTCRVGALVRDASRIVAATDQGVWVIDAESGRSRVLVSPPGLRLAISAANGPVHVSGEAGLFRLDGDQVLPVPLPEGTEQIQSLGWLDDTLWAGTSNEVLVWNGSTWSRPFAQFPGLGATVITRDAKGSWWLHDDQSGLVHLEPDGTSRPVAPELLRLGRIEQSLLDRSGNLWLGSNGRGLLRIRAATVAVLDDPELGLDLPAMPVISDGMGGQWLGLLCGGIRHLDRQGSMTTVPWFSNSAACPWSMARTDGTLWVGTSDGWLARAEGPEFDRLVPIRRLPEQPIIRAIVAAPQGGWWIALQGKLVWLPTDGLGDPRPIAALNNMTVNRIRPAREGGHWFVGDRGAVRIVDERAAEHITEADGLSSRFARDIFEHDDGTLWIGTYGGGVTIRRAGVLKTYRENDGLFDNTVSCFLADGAGRLWASGNRGISLFAADQVARAGTEPTLYTTGYAQSEGLRYAETNGGSNDACHRDESGRLWFPLVSGFAVVEPDHAVQSLRQASRPVIESVLVGGQVRPHSGTLKLAADARDIEIRYAAPNLSNSESIRFRVRLADTEDWTELGEQRSVFYPLLPYGELAFQVSARSADGTWLDMPEPLRMFHRQPWHLHPLAILSALILGVIAVLLGRRSVVGLLDARARRLAQHALRRAEDLTIDNQRLHRQANVDSLTGLANRRRFTEALAEIWTLPAMSPITLMMIDVDDFKRYNDTFGHPAGDACLQLLAQTLRTTMPPPALVARHGGEEFAIISPNSDEAAAGTLAERLRAAVIDLAHHHAPSASHPIVTISIGVCTVWPGPDMSPKQALAAADEALYRAKSGGRNQIQFAR